MVTDEGQDAEAQVVGHGGDDGAHAQHGEGGVTARDDEVAAQLPEDVPAQQMALQTQQQISLHHSGQTQPASGPDTPAGVFFFLLK